MGVREMTYNAFLALFASDNGDLIQDFIKYVSNALSQFGKTPTFNTAITYFSAVGASLLVIFFFMDLMSNVSRDMISFDKLVLMFIKLFIGFCILLFLPEIMKGLLSLIDLMFQATSNYSTSPDSWGFKFEGMKENGSFKKWDELSKDEANAIMKDKSLGTLFKSHFMPIVFSLIVLIASYMARGAAFFSAITQALSVLVRVFFSPIAVAQCFSEGQNSPAIRYIKKILGDGLALAVTVAVCKMANVLQASIAKSVLEAQGLTDIKFANVADLVCDGRVFVPMCVISFSMAGAIMKGSQIAHDIVGA